MTRWLDYAEGCVATDHTLHLREMSPRVTLSDESLWLSSSVNSETLERDEHLVGLCCDELVEFAGADCDLVGAGFALNNAQRRARQAAKLRARQEAKSGVE